MRYQLLTCATVLASSASARTLKQALAQHKSLHMLSSILETLDLFDTFENAENMTLLAMTNTAIRYLGDWGINLTTIDPEVARSILKYHFLEGIYDSASIQRYNKARLLHSTLRPPHFTNVTIGPVVKLTKENTSDCIRAESGLQKELSTIDIDIYYNGGIFHTIDSNLVLPHNLLETTNLGDLHEFWDLVKKSGSSLRLESLKDATYLIPSDNAIRNARSRLDKLTAVELAQVVAHHAVPNHVLYYNSIEREGVDHMTLLGESVTIWKLDSDHLFVNKVPVLRQDILVYGGVAHILDGVLMPGRVLEPESIPSTTDGSILSEANGLKGKENEYHALIWPLHLLGCTSAADTIFYAGLGVLFCGLLILSVLH